MFPIQAISQIKNPKIEGEAKLLEEGPFNTIETLIIFPIPSPNKLQPFVEVHTLKKKEHPGILLNAKPKLILILWDQTGHRNPMLE